MAKFKVLVIAITIKNNQIAKCGQLIDESQLNSSSEELVKQGFIEEVELELEVNKLEVKSEEVIETPAKAPNKRPNKKIAK